MEIVLNRVIPLLTLENDDIDIICFFISSSLDQK